MNSLNSYWKKFSARGHSGLLRWGSSPDTDWKIIFLTTLLLVVFASAFNFKMFVAVDQEEPLLLEENIQETSTPNLEKLRSTVFYYQNKANEFERFKAGASVGVPDPSI